MRVVLISLLATLSTALTATTASALEMRGYWLDNKAWNGVQAVVQLCGSDDAHGCRQTAIRSDEGEVAAVQ